MTLDELNASWEAALAGPIGVEMTFVEDLIVLGAETRLTNAGAPVDKLV
jgi:hypothetical protein